MIKLSLCGEWKLLSADNKYNLTGNIPGANYTDLMKAGMISDPFDKLNEADVRWVGETDWTYEKTFELDEKMYLAEGIYLNASGVDTLAAISINGELAAKTENAHIDYSFEIKKLLKLGANTIKIDFASPIKYIEEKNKLDKMPANMNGLNGFPHIRKPACHFGWDWGPILPPSGISGNIELVARETDYFFTDTRVDEQRGDNSVTFIMKAVLNKSIIGGRVNIRVTSPIGEIILEKTIESADGINFREEIFIESPMKWYANGMTKNAEQPLYSVKFIAICEKYETDCKEYQIGVRSIKIDTSADSYGSNFAFVVNGDTIFAKGANWIPADSFISRFEDKKLEYLIRSLAISNVNMIRVWGGGYYETDKFYSLCDKYGILVWQDFAFACAPYPFYDELFLNNIKSEVENVIKRIRHHAALAIWCGNNEIETMSLGWAARRKLIEYTEIFFYNVLPEIVGRLDGITPFINGSPFGSAYMKNVNSDTVGDTHLWAVWHGLQPFKYYRSRYTRFCSEFGFESLPDIDTIKSFAHSPEDLDIVSKVMLAHQKCNSGNVKMLYYAIDNFIIPDNFKDLIYITQLVQAESIKEAVEHWRRNKIRCNGALYWQYNDCWPTASWSSVDYFGRWKALQYYSKEFFAPFTISLHEEKNKVNLTVSNETIYPAPFSVKLNVMDFKGAIVYSAIESGEVAPFTVRNIEDVLSEFKITKANRNELFVCAELISDEKTIITKTLILSKPNALKLSKTNIQKSASIKNNMCIVTLKSDTYAHRVCLHLEGSVMPFSENFFDLIPDEVKTVKIPVGTRSAESCNKELTVTCYNDLVPKYTARAAKSLKLKIALMPMNIANRIYYKFS